MNDRTLESYYKLEQSVLEMRKSLLEIANMPTNCGGGRGNYCCGCIAGAIVLAQDAIDKEASYDT